MQHETAAKIPMLIDVAVKPSQPERPDLVRSCQHRLLRDFAVETLETPEKDDGQLVRCRLEAGIERLGAQFPHVESGKRGGVDRNIGRHSSVFG